MAEAAAERQTAVGLFIDEVQHLSSSELAAVIVACHEIAQLNLPFPFVGAGLPQVAALAGKARSYAERLFDYPEVGPLESLDARLALEKPAQAEGVSFDGDAVDEILAAARIFPASSRSGDIRSRCRCKPSRRLCVVRCVTTIAGAHGPSMDTSQPLRPHCAGRRRMQCTTMRLRESEACSDEAAAGAGWLRSCGDSVTGELVPGASFGSRAGSRRRRRRA